MPMIIIGFWKNIIRTKEPTDLIKISWLFFFKQ